MANIALNFNLKLNITLHNTTALLYAIRSYLVKHWMIEKPFKCQFKSDMTDLNKRLLNFWTDTRISYRETSLPSSSSLNWSQVTKWSQSPRTTFDCGNCFHVHTTSHFNIFLNGPNPVSFMHFRRFLNPNSNIGRTNVG